MTSYSSPHRGQIEAAGPSFGAGTLITGAVVVAALYFGRDVLVPFVVAVILSFVLAIPAKLLQGWGLGRVLPVAIVVVLAFLIIGAVAIVLASQIAELASELPRYQSVIQEKIATLKNAAAGHGPLDRLIKMLQTISGELGPGEPGQTAEPAPPGGRPAEPLPVEIARTRTNPIATALGYVATALHPLATTGLVVVFTVFMLMQRGDLRNRAIRLAGSRDLQRTTAAMNDAASRLSRFFLVQVCLNSTFGIAVGLGLWLMDVPSPILWGILAAISRFVPYIGVVLAAGGPLILAAAVDPHWTMLIGTAGFFVLIEVLVGQVVEPLVYGHSTGLTPVAVIASVTFWTWLWGPVGLILATPLTVCLVVLGRHVDRLAFLDVMLGDRPPLTVAEMFYQRVLAGDAGEVVEQAELFLKRHALTTYYDEVAVRGLALAQVDLARGALDESALDRIQEACAQLVEELADHSDVVAGEAVATQVKRAVGDEDLDRTLASADALAANLPQAEPGREGEAGGPTVLCVAGRNDLDRICADMLAQILGRHGLRAQAAGSQIMTAGDRGQVAGEVGTVCVSYLDTSSPAHVRYAVRRLRRRFPAARIVVGSWGRSEDDAKLLCEASRSDGCAHRLVEAAQLCLAQEAPAVVPAHGRREDADQRSGSPDAAAAAGF